MHDSYVARRLPFLLSKCRRIRDTGQGVGAASEIRQCNAMRSSNCLKYDGLTSELISAVARHDRSAHDKLLFSICPACSLFEGQHPLQDEPFREFGARLGPQLSVFTAIHMLKDAACFASEPHPSARTVLIPLRLGRIKRDHEESSFLHQTRRHHAAFGTNDRNVSTSSAPLPPRNEVHVSLRHIATRLVIPSD